MRRWRVIVLSIALALAGCAGVPDSSVPVVVGPAPTGAGNGQDPGLGIQPGGPVDGSSSDQIVRDFFKALTAADPEFKVAREYLTPDVAKSWRPGGGVLVVGTAWGAQPGTKDGTVNFTADRVALAISIALRAVPATAEVATETRDAARARGLERNPRAILTPFVVRVVRDARLRGEALHARGVGDDQSGRHG